MNTGVIYGLKDPRTPWRIRYVGSTVCVARRLKDHRRNAKGAKDVLAWVRTLREANVQVELEELEVLEYSNANEEQLSCREQEWIDLLSCFFPLLNKGGTTSRIHAPVQKSKYAPANYRYKSQLVALKQHTTTGSG